MTPFQVDPNGFYGDFGGAFVPSILEPIIKELQDTYLQIIESKDFQEEFHTLLRDYVGRPSPLYHARRLSEKYGAKIYLKREDLNHTGRTRSIMPSGRSCWRRRWVSTASSPRRVQASMV